MNEEEKYLKGKENWIIRAYFYCSNGLNIINEFRNLFLGIFALYFALKLDNIVWLFVMTIPSILLLTLAGYYMVHRVGKVKEYLSIKFGTHYGMKTYDYQKGQFEILERIELLLKEKQK